MLGEKSAQDREAWKMLERSMLESETMESLSFPKPAFNKPEQQVTSDQCHICPWGSSDRYYRVRYPEVVSSLSLSRVLQGLDEELRPVVSSL